MQKWNVEIEWVIRRYTTEIIEADSEDQAAKKARQIATAPLITNEWVIEDISAERQPDDSNKPGA